MYKKNKKKMAPLLLVLLAAIVAFFIYIVPMAESKYVPVKNVSYTEVVNDIKAHSAARIVLDTDDETVDLTYFDENNNLIAKKRAYIPDNEVFVNLVQNEIVDNGYEVRFTSEKGNSFLSGLIGILFASLILFTFIYFVLKNSKSSYGKIAAMNYDVKPVNLEGENYVAFKDVAGLDEEKEKLCEVVEILKNPSKYTKMGIKTPKGVLLKGGPGLGKTMLAKAVACEAGVPFYSVSGSEFIEKFVGVGASRIRDLFKEAKKNAPAVIFIDEIDAIGRKRTGGSSGGDNELIQTLNQLLTEMDGFKSRNDIVVLAATNRADVLDSALLRPGRFGRQIEVGAPDVNAREEILKVYANGKPISTEVDFKEVAKDIPGFSGADIENLLNEAAIVALKKNRKAIFNDDIKEATRVVLVGLEKKNRAVNQNDRKITAYHEAGHAITQIRSKKLKEEVREISIIARGSAGGYTWSTDAEETSYYSKNELKEKIVGLLGGRAAEDIIFQDVTTGASNDLERATSIAKAMVKVYGMSEKIGLACLKQEYAGENPLGLEVDRIAGEEIKAILSESYTQSKNILESNKELLERVAKELLEKETVSGKRFVEIVDAYDKERK